MAPGNRGRGARKDSVTAIVGVRAFGSEFRVQGSGFRVLSSLSGFLK